MYLHNILQTYLLVVVLILDVIESLKAPDEGYTTTWNDALLHGSTSGIQGVCVSVFLFVHFDFAGSTDLWLQKNQLTKQCFNKCKWHCCLILNNDKLCQLILFP